MNQSNKSLINNFCQKKKVKSVIEFTDINGKFFKCQIKIPGYEHIAQGAAPSKSVAQEKASDEMVQFLQVCGEMDDDGNVPAPAPVSAPVNIDGPSVGQKRSYDEMKQPQGVAGYTLENARSALNMFLQKNRQPTDMLVEAGGGPAHDQTFIASMKVYIPRLRRTITGREPAKNKKLAQSRLALSLVKQMYELGALQDLQGSATKTKAKIALTSCDIASHMCSKLESVLQQAGIQPVQVPDTPLPEDADPIPLLLPDILDNPEDYNNNQDEDKVIDWSPPSLRYNPWLASPAREYDINGNEYQVNANLASEFNSKTQDSVYITRQEEKAQLPVFNFRAELLEMIRASRCILVRGGTGCGKSTQIPQFILDDFIQNNRGSSCNIVVTQPRRISATSIADRVAWERAEETGQSVGYSVRFDSVFPRPYGSILYCTTGTLLRKLSNGLHGISHILVDEIHERDINTDFLLIILREMLSVHSELRVVLMSATVDVALFTQYFSCPMIEIPERTFPVTRYFLEDAVEMLDFVPPPPRKKGRSGNKKNPLAGDDYCADSDEEDCKQKEVDENLNLCVDRQQYSHSTAQAMAKMSEREFSFELVEKILDWILTQPEHGSVLVFLPGWNHIFALQKYLQDHPTYGSHSFWLLPLHSQIPKDEQKRVFVPAPEGFTKIILATNIAETSITINDCIYVIDLCKAKIKEFFIKKNLADYRLLWASRTNLEQRAGRAGRVRPGVCFHLCSRARYNAMAHHINPEIQRTALHSIALTIKALNLGNIEEFLGRALEAPSKAAITNAVTVLHEMGALSNNGEITPMGHCLARLPLEPRLSQTILMSCLFRCGDPMATIAAATCFREPWISHNTRAMSWQHKALSGRRHSDHVAMLNAYNQWERVAANEDKEQEQRFCDDKSMSSMTLQMIQSAKHQLVSIIQNMGFSEECFAPVDIDVNRGDRNLDILVALLAGGLYPNICIHHEKRKLWVSESQQALMHKSSTNCTNGKYIFPSPYFAYGEKIKTKVIAAKTTTMVSPLHLILFGSSSVILYPDRVLLDEWIPIKMPGRTVAVLCGIRKAIELLLMKCAHDPYITTSVSGVDYSVLEAVYALSDPKAGKFCEDESPRFQSGGPPRNLGEFRGGRGYRGRGGFPRGARGGFGGNYRGGFGGGNRGGFSRSNFRGGFSVSSRGGFGGSDRGSYDNNNNRGGYDNNYSRGGYGGNNRGGYDGNSRGGYDANSRGGYDDNSRGGYDRNNRGGYEQSNRGGYDWSRGGGSEAGNGSYRGAY